MEIKDLIRKLVEDATVEVYSLVCIVDSIDTTTKTVNVSPANGAAKIFDVRLQSGVSMVTGVTCYPKLQSEVLVSFISKELAYVSLFGEIDKIEYQLNAELDGGVPYSSKMAEEINKLKDDFKNLKAIFDAWVTVPNDGGAALKVGLGGWTPNDTHVTKEQISNPKIFQ